ncbi:MAG: GTP-binding protein [Anaerolineae bacterium]|nr:GTP-binding protein [Anaerolineae bacterium]
MALRPLQKALDALPTSIFRAKGVVFLADDPAHRYIVQVVGKRARVERAEPWGGLAPRSQMVAIGAHESFDPADLEARFEACLASNAPKGSLQRLGSALLNWVRPGS